MLTNNAIALILISLGVIAISITVHEFFHGLVSNWLGDDTAKLSGRLTLNPLKHIDIFTTVLLPIILLLSNLPPFGAAKPVPINPSKLKFDEYGTAIVGVAGPLSNLLLAILGSLVLRVFGTLNSEIWLSWWWLFIIINIGFFIFNLIPFPPLDGSRVMFAFAPRFLQNVMLGIESFGFFAIVIFMFLIFPVLSPLLQTLNGKLINFLIGF